MMAPFWVMDLSYLHMVEVAGSFRSLARGTNPTHECYTWRPRLIPSPSGLGFQQEFWGDWNIQPTDSREGQEWVTGLSCTRSHIQLLYKGTQATSISGSATVATQKLTSSPFSLFPAWYSWRKLMWQVNTRKISLVSHMRDEELNGELWWSNLQFIGIC